ncbi:MAG: ZIP family metal transporter [Thermoproteota archaeon]|nr:MAG: ZIP family metal transporter [Candidatus Korarchaeota archaeon]
MLPRVLEHPLAGALLAGLVTSALNAMGATPVLLLKAPPRRLSDAGLGFAAGVMLAASFTSLIQPAIEAGGVAAALAGVLAGALAMSLLDYVTPHLHVVIGREGLPSRLSSTWMLALAMTLHNMPEGLAVGVAFASGSTQVALAVMAAIGLQNIPEGLAVGFSMLSEGESRPRAYMIAVASGLVEAPLSLAGAIAVSAARALLPYAMGFAAGAMLFVVSDEIIPETHRLGRERAASYGLIAGLILMLYLDSTL